VAGLAALGAGLGLGTASAAAIAAIAEKAELFGRTLVYIVLIEAIAIYGLAMFFIIFSLL
jgi:V/A-type H+-transporting ATPase subunit K